MSAPEVEKPLEERIRQSLDELQHSHVNINQTTRGVTFEIKVRDIDPYEAMRKALDIYRKMKTELGVDDR